MADAAVDWSSSVVEMGEVGLLLLLYISKVPSPLCCDKGTYSAAAAPSLGKGCCLIVPSSLGRCMSDAVSEPECCLLFCGGSGGGGALFATPSTDGKIWGPRGDALSPRWLEGRPVSVCSLLQLTRRCRAGDRSAESEMALECGWNDRTSIRGER